MQTKVPIVAITVGDPAGIGPEVTLKALNSFTQLPCIPLVLCRIDVLQEYYHSIMPKWDSITINDIYSIKKINQPFFVTIPFDTPLPQPSKGNEYTGKESLLFIDTAIELWKRKCIDAVVTGPVSKALIQKWIPFKGHTEYFAEKLHESQPRMLMYSGQYNVLLVTTHIAIDSLLQYIQYESIYSTIEICYRSMKKIVKTEPRLAICGLDPHCGDDGAIGEFDKTVTRSAVEAAKSKGITIHGPFSADTIFIPDNWKQFDCIIAHYHDQGLVPFKMVAFDEGVNVTVGLSIIRTSVDHGTAFDIAGKDCAQYTSMKKAIELACMLVHDEKG